MEVKKRLSIDPSLTLGSNQLYSKSFTFLEVKRGRANTSETEQTLTLSPKSPKNTGESTFYGDPSSSSFLTIKKAALLKGGNKKLDFGGLTIFLLDPFQSDILRRLCEKRISAIIGEERTIELIRNPASAKPKFYAPNQQVEVKTKGIFGMPLHLALKKTEVEYILEQGVSVKVPFIVHQCLKFLSSEETLKTDGIFRKPGHTRRMAELQVLFDTRPGKPVDFSDYSVHDVAGLLKRYIRELPEPLFTLRLQNLFFAAQELSNLSRKLVCYQLLLIILPKPNRDLLQAILFFLKKIAKNSNVEDGNRMDSHNLAVIFAPNIAKSPSTTNPTQKGAELTLKQAQEEGKESQQLVETLIDNCEDLFSFQEKTIVEYPLSRGDTLSQRRPRPQDGKEENQENEKQDQNLTNTERFLKASKRSKEEFSAGIKVDITAARAERSIMIGSKSRFKPITKIPSMPVMKVTESPTKPSPTFASSSQINKEESTNSTPPIPEDLQTVPAPPPPSRSQEHLPEEPLSSPITPISPAIPIAKKKLANQKDLVDGIGENHSLPGKLHHPFGNMDSVGREGMIQEEEGESKENKGDEEGKKKEKEENGEQEEAEEEEISTSDDENDWEPETPSTRGRVFEGEGMNQALSQRIQRDIKKKREFIFGEIRLSQAEKMAKKLHKNVNPNTDSVKNLLPSVNFSVNLDEMNIFEVFQKLQHESNGVEVKDRRKNLKLYKNCFVGKEAIDWLCVNTIEGKTLTRLQAQIIAREMLEMGFFQQVLESSVDFKDDQIYYRFSPNTQINSPNNNPNPNPINSSGSNSSLNLPLSNQLSPSSPRDKNREKETEKEKEEKEEKEVKPLHKGKHSHSSLPGLPMTPTPPKDF